MFLYDFWDASQETNLASEKCSNIEHVLCSMDWLKEIFTGNPTFHGKIMENPWFPVDVPFNPLLSKLPALVAATIRRRGPASAQAQDRSDGRSSAAQGSQKAIRSERPMAKESTNLNDED
jgi:hypothetical protein